MGLHLWWFRFVFLGENVNSRKICRHALVTRCEMRIRITTVICHIHGHFWYNVWPARFGSGPMSKLPFETLILEFITTWIIILKVWCDGDNVRSLTEVLCFNLLDYGIRMSDIADDCIRMWSRLLTKAIHWWEVCGLYNLSSRRLGSPKLAVSVGRKL